MLPNIFSNIGEDYDERILPSITNEVLKAVVVSKKFIVVFALLESNIHFYHGTNFLYKNLVFVVGKIS